MHLFAWLIKIIIFIALLGFALGNTETVHLAVFGKQELGFDAPMVVFLLLFFLAGMLVGLITLVPRILRQRRQIKRLRRDLTRYRDGSAQVAEEDGTLIGSSSRLPTP